MFQKPAVFISSTSDLRSARDLVAKVLQSIGYEPVWQDIQPTDGGELLKVLRRQMAPCKLMIQLVGHRYGSEPPAHLMPSEFGRVSYTQFEARYFEKTLKRKVIYLFIEPAFPTDPVPPESPELSDLQGNYEAGIKDDNRLHTRISTKEELEAAILKIRDELAKLRRQASLRYRILILLLVFIAAMVARGITILRHGQAEQGNKINQQSVKIDQSAKATTQVVGDLMGRLDESEKLIKQFLAERPLDSKGQPIIPQLTGDLKQRAEELIAKGTKRQRLIAAVAMNDFTTADRLVAEILAQQKAERETEDFGMAVIQGDRWYRAREFDKAVEHYETAIRLRPGEIYRRNDAAIAHSLARLGDIAAHQKRAIEISEGTLKLVPANSLEWAMTQNTLAGAWHVLPTGDHDLNEQKALAAYQAALSVYTREANPVEWAKTQNNIGNSWTELRSGDRSANLMNAVAAFNAALMVRTRESNPEGWAMTHLNLGNAWQEMPAGSPAENLSKSIAAYEAALSVYTRESHPDMWAMAQSNLGNAILQIPSEHHAENVLKAIRMFDGALTIFTREGYPFDWARVHFNRARAFADLSQRPEKRCENLRQAISSGKAALTVLTPEAFPEKHAEAAKNLDLYRQGYEMVDCAEKVPFHAIPPAK